MALLPHHHSGRIVHHRATSYGGLSLLLLIVGITLAGITGATKAENVTVQAAVVGPKPTNAPAITYPVNGQHFTNNPIDIRGTCDPGLLVNIYKNDVLLGATLCNSQGKFSLQGDIFIGRNELVARMYDQANQPSPDSATVTVYSDIVGVPSLSGTTSFGTKGNVILKAESIYKGTVPGQSLSWPITIEGGTPPYAISIEWGDGQTELISRPNAGVFSIEHVYDKAGAYKGSFVLVIRAVDADGTSAMMQLVAIVNNPVGAPVGLTQVGGPSTWWRLIVAWPLWLILVLLLISYWLGERRQKQIDDRNRALPMPQIPVAT